MSEIHDLVNSIQQVPTQMAQKYVDLLNSLMHSFIQLAQKSLERSRKAEQADSSALTAKFKTNPKHPTWLTPGKEEELVKEEYHHNTPTLKRPGS